jgi:hypothetical protein
MSIKTYKEVWDEKKQSMVITYVIWLVICFIISAATGALALEYCFLVAMLVSAGILFATIHFQRYSV